MSELTEKPSGQVELSQKIQTLIFAMKNETDIWKRREAAFELEPYSYAEVTRALVEAALQEKDPNVLEGVAIALGNDLRTKEVIPALKHIKGMEGHQYRWSKMRAEEGLKKLELP